MKKQDLIKAAEDLNELLFDEDKKHEGWIYTDSTEDLMIDEIKKAALWLKEEDVEEERLEAGTIKLLQSLDWPKEIFENLEDPEEQDPLPAFYRFEIIPDPSKAVKPKRRTRKKKEEPVPEVNEEPTPEPVPEHEPEPEPEPEEDPSDAEQDKSAENILESQPEPGGGMTAYTYALEAMGKNPTTRLRDLTTSMADEGYDMFVLGNSVKTAHSVFRKIYRILKENEHIKE